MTVASATCRSENLARRVDERADGHRDDHELGARHRLGQRRRRRVERRGADCLAKRRRVGVPARDARDSGPPRGESDGGAEEPGSDHRERAHGGPGRPRGRLGGPRLGPGLLLHHVEHRGEKSLHSGLGERPGVGLGELTQERGLPLGVDHRRPRLLLVRG